VGELVLPPSRCRRGTRIYGGPARVGPVGAVVAAIRRWYGSRNGCRWLGLHSRRFVGIADGGQCAVEIPAAGGAAGRGIGRGPGRRCSDWRASTRTGRRRSAAWPCRRYRAGHTTPAATRGRVRISGGTLY